MVGRDFLNKYPSFQISKTLDKVEIKIKNITEWEMKIIEKWEFRPRR